MEVCTIEPKSGTALQLNKGQSLKVICPHGEQVADMTAYNATDFKECLSNGKTFDYEETLRLTVGNMLFSNLSNPMLDIIEDTCGIHDFLLAPCCENTMKHFYNIVQDHPSCLDNLYIALKKYEVEKWAIPTAFNIFMNVELDDDRSIKVRPPKAKAGDYIIFKAKMDLIIGLTACSAKDSNGNSFKPIEYQILD